MTFKELQNSFKTEIKCECLHSFVEQITKKCINDTEYVYLFRGECAKYKTNLYPCLFRNQSWIDSEDDMLKSIMVQFPNEFPKGMRSFDALVDAQHFGLPTRLLDFSYSPLVALFMASYDYKGDSDKIYDESVCVYAVKVKRDAIKSVNSDTVTLLSNLAKTKKNFWDNGITREVFDNYIHIVKDERVDFYNIHYKPEKEYKTDFCKIIFAQPRMTNPRIIRQQGLFAIFGFKDSKSNIEDLEIKCDDPILFTFGKNCKEQIRKNLSLFGFTQMSMFPDLQNVCECIKEKFESK